MSKLHDMLDTVIKYMESEEFKREYEDSFETSGKARTGGWTEREVDAVKLGYKLGTENAIMTMRLVMEKAREVEGRWRC